MKRTLQTMLFALMAMLMPIAAWAQDATVEAQWGTSATDLTDEGTLDEAISAAAVEGSTVKYIQLQSDVTTEHGYNISSGVFTIDLNGYAVTSSSDEIDIFTIFYSGTHVTFTDTHADATGKVESGCYAVFVGEEGSVTIAGGTYKGTTVVSVGPECSTSITGGTFQSTHLYTIESHGSLIISGGTFAEGSVCAIEYCGGVLDLSGYASPLGISVRNYSDAVVLPEGYSFYDGEGNPVTELEYYIVYAIGNADGTTYTVTFDASDGEGTMEDYTTSPTGRVTLPECTFTAPEGKMFKAWQVGDSEYLPDDVVIVTADVTVMAVWRDYVPQIVIKMADSAHDGWHGNAIVVKEDGEEVGTVTIKNGEKATFTCDYDSSTEYTFYWQFGEEENRYPEECSFEILVEGKQVFAAVRNENEGTSDCEGYEDGQLLYTIVPTTGEVETLTLTDGELTEYSSTVELTTVGTLTYERTLPNTAWNALYVPFEIPVTALTDNYDVAYVNNVHAYDTDEDGTIDDLAMEVITIKSGTLNANYPYLIRAKSEAAKEMSLVITDATLRRTVENRVTCSSVFMRFDVTGTYKQMTPGDLTDEEGNASLVITTDGSWQQLAEGSTLNPFRLYLTMTALDGSPVKVDDTAMARMRIVTRGESEGTTRIENSKLKIGDSGAVYDLQGRRVENPGNGIYIVNGKKIIVK